MKSLIALAAVAAVAAIAAPASAQTWQSLPSYVKPITFNASLGYTGITWKQNNLGAVTLRGGADFGKYVGVEGEGSFGVSDATANIAGLSAKTHLNNAYAGYFVGRFPVNEQIGLFARVGYGHVDAQQTAAIGTVSATAKTGVDSLNYGAGGQYMFDGKNGLRIEYTRFDFREHNSQAADTWSLGYVRKF